MKQEMNSVSLVVTHWPIYEDTAFRPKKKKRKEEKRKGKKRKEKKRKEKKRKEKQQYAQHWARAMPAPSSMPLTDTLDRASVITAEGADPQGACTESTL
jgi:hypothetical protein